MKSVLLSQDNNQQHNINMVHKDINVHVGDVDGAIAILGNKEHATDESILLYMVAVNFCWSRG